MATQTTVAKVTCARVSMVSCQYPRLRISRKERATNTVSAHLRWIRCARAANRAMRTNGLNQVRVLVTPWIMNSRPWAMASK
ncbi:hypothetical protein D3C79_1060240 [compost metagenome]